MSAAPGKWKLYRCCTSFAAKNCLVPDPSPAREVAARWRLPAACAWSAEADTARACLAAGAPGHDAFARAACRTQRGPPPLGGAAQAQTRRPALRHAVTCALMTPSERPRSPDLISMHDCCDFTLPRIRLEEFSAN